MTFRPAHPHAPRPIRFRGLVEHLGFRLKRYTVTLPGAALDEPIFSGGRGLALSALPEPAVTPERPGVGFVIEHQGRGLDHVVLAWWDREDELPVRVIVGDDAGWRPAREESFSVFDLEVMAAERDAYVAAVLAPGGGGVERYLATVAAVAGRP
ncbi:MAG TPA: hypothetical protein VML50_16925 [Anaeromyxobacter sp.]|nr:hypothetical protein [Anaeromyxobacter sp.]